MTLLAAHITLACGLIFAQVVPPATEPPPRSAAPEEESPSGRIGAQAALAAGNRHLKEGDASAAISEYRRAQAAYPPAAAKIEFNVAKAEELRGDTAAAANALELFLETSAEISADFRQEAREELLRLAPSLAAVRITKARQNLSILIDEAPHGSTPLARNLWLRPGRHEIVLKEGDRVLLRRSINPASGATTFVDGSLPPLALAAPRALALNPLSPHSLVAGPLRPTPGAAPVVRTAPSPYRPFWKQWWFWAGAAAVVAAGTATVLVLADNCPANTTCMSPH